MEVAFPAPPATAKAVPSVYLVTPNSAGGNVGTLVRACAAFDATALLLVGHPRHATHGAHGAQRHVKVMCAFDWNEAAAYLHSKGCELVAVVGPKGSPSYAAFQSALKEEQGGGGGGAIVASDGGITSASLKNGVNDSCTSNSASTSTSASTSGGATSSSSDSTITSGNMSNISGTAKAHVTFPAHERRFLGSTALVMALAPESARIAARVCNRATFLAQFQPLTPPCIPTAATAVTDVTATGAAALAPVSTPSTGESGKEWPPIPLDLSTVACGVLHHFASWAHFSIRNADKYKFDIERTDEHRRSRKGHAERVSYPGMVLEKSPKQPNAMSASFSSFSSPLADDNNDDGNGDENFGALGGLFGGLE